MLPFRSLNRLRLLASLMTKAVFASLYEATLLCRPRNFLKFSIRYLQDCKASNPDEAHAFHCLPFLLYNPEEFQNAACTIFCAYATGRSVLLADSPSAFREHLDGGAVLEIIQCLDLPALSLQSTLIDEMIAEKVDSLKQVDFPLFVSILRCLLSCYAAHAWVREEVGSLMQRFSPAAVKAPIGPDTVVDAVKLRHFLAKQPSAASTSAPCCGCSSYHLHYLGGGLEAQESTRIMFSKLLLAVMEDEGPRGGQQHTLEALQDRFLKRFLAHQQKG